MTNSGGAVRKYDKRIIPILAVLVVAGLFMLPIAVWLDMRSLSERMLRLHADDTGRVIDTMRAFYASDVVGRVIHANTTVTATHTYKNTPGAIPIPATLSLELGRRISQEDGATKYRFVSDLPFKGRESHHLDAFEQDALQAMRRHAATSVVATSGSIFDRQVRVATPVVMGPVCVACHDTHPDSPKTDWKVGDVRGIQEIIIRQPLVTNIFAFKYLLAYLVCAALAGFAVIAMQRRQARLIMSMNTELSSANGFLTAISAKLAKYLPAQVHKGIFEGRAEADATTRRKKLTIFFSDIKDFTAAAERMQPEELTTLLNEYFTEMAAIAHLHGGTVDKFIGDAMLVFFGDPETNGERNDALACLTMAMEMQRRLEQLNAAWRRRGIGQPFRARMGVNTGYCNVGNFGSQDRLDYTIIGAEANLAARLQANAEPGQIMLSFETYALVRDQIRARALPPIQMKGIAREVVPYVVEGWCAERDGRTPVIEAHTTGLDLVLDVDALDEDACAQARRRLEDALEVINLRTRAAAA